MLSFLESCDTQLDVPAHVGHRAFVLLAACDGVVDTGDDHGRHELRQVSNSALNRASRQILTIRTFQLNVVASKFRGDCGKKFMTKHTIRKHTPMVLRGNPQIPRFQGRGRRGSPTRRFRMIQLIETM